MTTLWMCDPSSLPHHNGRQRALTGPLFDLPALQAHLRQGQLDLSNSQQFHVATDDCWKNLRALRWSPSKELKQALILLKAGSRKEGRGDYLNSQWARDSDGQWLQCDAYSICINEQDGFVRQSGAPETYIKFSVDEDNCLCLLLISCHPSS